MTGCSRALLCTTNGRGQLSVHQLNATHNLANQSELERLAKLGLDPARLCEAGRLTAGIDYTRSIGDVNVKRGYKDIELLRYFSCMTCYNSC